MLIIYNPTFLIMVKFAISKEKHHRKVERNEISIGLIGGD